MNIQEYSQKYSQEYFLSAGETNAEAEMSLPLLTSRIIDISTAHANQLHIGNPDMAERGCGWVLSRLALEMFRYPKVNERYRLTTWIESYNRHFSERIVQVSDESGEPLGYSRAIWMILDYHTRESVGLSHLPIPGDLPMPGRCPIAAQGKHAPVCPQNSDGELPRGAVRATAEPYMYRFKYCDLDFYRHVNTVRYIELLLNRLTLEDFDATTVRRMELAFMHESTYGREALVYRCDDGLTTFFSINDCETDSPSLIAKIQRIPR